MTNDQLPMTNELPIPNDPSARPKRSVWKRRWMIIAEVVLVLVIIALLIATWLPAFIGARPGVNPGR